MTEQPISPPDDDISYGPDEPSYDELRQIDIDVKQVTHKFPLNIRIQGVITAFNEDDFDGFLKDVDVAIEVLKECQIVIRQADDNFKDIAKTCDEIDQIVDILKGTRSGRMQA